MTSKDFYALKKSLKDKQSYAGELVISAADNSSLYLSVNMVMIGLTHTEPQFMMVFKNLTTQKKVIKLSETDTLTKIPNRLKAEKIIKREMSHALEHKTKLSFCIIDIDFFKKINDTYGHLVGDQILITLSELIQNNIRKSDFFARWGGEEFILVLPNTDIDEAQFVCEEIRKVIANHIFPHIKQLTVSIGLTELKAHDTFLTLFKRADQALYDAKNSGRNNVYL